MKNLLLILRFKSITPPTNRVAANSFLNLKFINSFLSLHFFASVVLSLISIQSYSQ